MTPPRVFITGVTGYIGGDILHELVSHHPDWKYYALVRNSDRANRVTKQYPDVNTVLGELDDSSVLEDQAAQADIVIHTADASDHAPAARAIAAGLAKGHSPVKPAFWLHTSGTGILTFHDSREDRYGEPHDKVYNDLEGVAELTNLPDDAFHRDVDKIVLEAADRLADSVKVAIVCPPTIYGPGRGPVNQRSRQLPALVGSVLDTGKAPIIGRGLARWNFVHVHDLSQLYRLLAEAASIGNANAELWGAQHGYYLAETEELAWGDVARLVWRAAKQQGLISTSGGSGGDGGSGSEDTESAVDTVQMDKEQAMDLAGFQALSWGLNSRGEARRAKKYLGWAPKSKTVAEEIPGAVKTEHDLGAQR